MIRTFCDCCGKEMEGINDPKRLQELELATPMLSMVKMHITAQVNTIKQYGASNVSHVCYGCIADAVSRGDKRPTAA